MLPPAKLVTAVGRPPAAEGGVLRRLRGRRAEEPRELEATVQALPRWVWLVFGTLAGLGLLTVNGSLTTFAILELPLFFLLLWRRGEPPALLFVCFFQWLQASVAILYTDFYGLPLRHVSSDEFIDATWLSLFGVLVLAAGMRLGMYGMKKSSGVQADAAAQTLSIPKLFNGYLLCFVGLGGLRVVAAAVPGLAQALLVALNFKWIIVILLMFAIVRQQRQYGLLLAVLLLESALGVLGYFSHFKSVYFVLGVVLLASPAAFRPGKIMAVTAVLTFSLSLAIVWSVIKSDYREYLNQGTGQQVVLVSVGERIDKLQELVGGLNAEKMQQGIESLVLRVTYVQFFALSLFNVPQNLPHEHGKLWLGAVEHVFMPRLFFPNKAAIDDSARTSYYTGIMVAGAEQGTSIGIGYMGESYIDFGRKLMFLPVLLLGVVLGGIYRVFVRRAAHPLLGMAVATTILMFTNLTIEQSNIKIFGGVVIAFVVLGGCTLMFGRAFWKLIVRPALPQPSVPAR